MSSIGHNPTKSPFRRARLGLDVTTQQVVDDYKARSVWSAWWTLDEKVRRRYFTPDERRIITRHGPRLDELACFRDPPVTDRERHFAQVCMGEAEPQSPTERLRIIAEFATSTNGVQCTSRCVWGTTIPLEFISTVLAGQRASFDFDYDQCGRATGILTIPTGYWMSNNYESEDGTLNVEEDWVSTGTMNISLQYQCR